MRWGQGAPRSQGHVPRPAQELAVDVSARAPDRTPGAPPVLGPEPGARAAAGGLPAACEASEPPPPRSGCVIVRARLRLLPAHLLLQMNRMAERLGGCSPWCRLGHRFSETLLSESFCLARLPFSGPLGWGAGFCGAFLFVCTYWHFPVSAASPPVWNMRGSPPSLFPGLCLLACNARDF